MNILTDLLTTNDIMLTQVWGAACGSILASLPTKSTHVVVVADPEARDDLINDLALFGKTSLPFPAWDVLPTETDTPDLDIAGDRIMVLRALSSSSCMVVASISALLQPTLDPASLRQAHLAVSAGMETSPEALSGQLLEAGFEHFPQVDGPGQLSRRGGIVDVFPFFGKEPVRIEFFGDEVDTVRYFDTGSQRSSSPTDEEVILVEVTRDSFRIACEKSNSSLFDYLPADSRIWLLHPDKISYMIELYRSGFEEDILLPASILAEAVRNRPITVITEIDGEEWPADLWRAPRKLQPIVAGVESVERLSGNLQQAIDEMRLLLNKDAAITIYCHNEGEKQRLHELLLEKGKGIAAELDLALGHISKGFYWPDKNWAALGDHEIFARKLIRRTPKKRFSGAPINDFTDLNPRDYVVHLLHGIARFEGIETLESNGTEQDYLVLRFAEDARVYVPLSHVELVQKYIGSREARPNLSKLGGAAWTRRKTAVEKAVKDIAADLLRLQAVRKTVKGISISEDDSLIRELEASFPYEETPDQLSAIIDIRDDQQQASPMDRLLCGDVGFGKTEVAIRAAFRVVNDGMQAAILVPTTILAEQHHRTFSERLADYPVTVACLSRFRSGVEQKRIVEACHEGRVDIVIGTHRLLSKDVGFKNLGLVVIDEEQRFGVEHKERLKSMRASVDILTMTATPIPRTLHMALLGLRDISNLVTPPSERQAVKTIVAKYKDELVRRAILRELVRGGQCFFLHNRVHNIDSIAAGLSQLVPEARFGIAHGQMAEGQLFEVMSRFLEGKIDVLVCTTIIESGVDIPSVNTLFVNNANHFGLADLHQLRGRVGRYCHQAYAYFLVPPQRPVTPVAQKRLQALMEYAELGAGFRLAMRDLELRGAGNVLGVQQSGHIHQIGFDLYCRLLEKSVAEFNGETMEESEPVELDLGTRGFIPGDYIISESQRIDMYRRLNSARDLAALQNIREYITDRYGALPESVERCLADQKIRCDATAVGICFIGRLDNALVIGFARNMAKDGVSRLRLLGRKVTPLEKQRWRIELSTDEMETEILLNLVEAIITWFDKPVDTPSPLRGVTARTPKLNVIYAGRGASNRTSRIDLMTSSIEFSSEPKEKEDTFAVQKLETSGSILKVYLKSNETNFFGTVTLITQEQRYFLRCTGTTLSPDGFTGLVLQADDEDEAERILKESAADVSLMQGAIE